MQKKKQSTKGLRTVPFLRFELRSGIAHSEEREFPVGPVRFSFSSPCEVNLGSYCPGQFQSPNLATPLFTLDTGDGALTVASQVPLLICGVERNVGRLPPEGTLRYGNLRIRFLGYGERKEALPVGKPKPWIPRLLQAATAMVVLIVLALQLAFQLTSRYGQKTTDRPLSGVSVGGEQRDASTYTPPRPIHPLPETPLSGQGTRMFAPGATLPGETMDLLFIHAHPDDESLEFGTLLALADRAGLSTAVLLLTDGEGGVISSNYTGSRDNLRDIRIREATEALSILGVSWYLRMGYQNHPYGGTLDRRRPEDVLEIWGGDAAVAAVAELISLLRPRIVVAPGGPSQAREHFEHEAAGLLVRRALEVLSSSGGYLPEGLLTAVDPRRSAAYSGLTAIPRSEVLDRQKAALAAHATQLDATHFGLLMVDQYPFEWYLPVFGPGGKELLYLIGK